MWNYFWIPSWHNISWNRQENIRVGSNRGNLWERGNRTGIRKCANKIKHKHCYSMHAHLGFQCKVRKTIKYRCRFCKQRLTSEHQHHRWKRKVASPNSYCMYSDENKVPIVEHQVDWIVTWSFKLKWTRKRNLEEGLVWEC